MWRQTGALAVLPAPHLLGVVTTHTILALVQTRQIQLGWSLFGSLSGRRAEQAPLGQACGDV